MGLSSSGTEEDAATAKDSGTPFRSEQIRANCSGVNSNGAPVVRSVAVISSRGPPRRAGKSAKVLPRYSLSSFSASTSLRPYRSELERSAGGQVGGGDQQPRPAAPRRQIGKGLATVQLVQLLGQHVAAAIPGRADTV